MLKIPEIATIWTIGTGDGTRNYFDIFKKYGIICVGPGNPGKNGSTEALSYYKANPKITDWGSALEDIKENDFVIARKGSRQILGIGIANGVYKYSKLLDDVEGWDLQHYMEVVWLIPKNGIFQLTTGKFNRATLSQCHQQQIIDQIISLDYDVVDNSIKLPYESIIKNISFNLLKDYLVDKGIRIQDTENISTTIERVIRLTNWYYQNDYNVLEHEIKAFLILPFLVALGWSEQKIKLEYSQCDIAIFNSSFNGDYKKHPYIIIEAKTFDDGLAFTHLQMETYSHKFPECKKYVATNGFRYNYYEIENNEFVLKGSFNLLKLKERDYLTELPLNLLEAIFAISNY